MPKEPKRGHRLNIFRGRFRYCSRTSQTEIASIDQLIMPVGLIKKAHPVFFDLYRIKFPVTAIVSIAHRISGVMLALFVPALVYLLQLSLASPQDFTNVVALFHQGVIRGIAVCLFWILAHHVLAGRAICCSISMSGRACMLRGSVDGQCLRSNWVLSRDFPVKGPLSGTRAWKRWMTFTNCFAVAQL